jgi:hypothetical protein
VDAGQLVYPLIAFSHVGDALEMRPASCVAGELVLLGMRKLVRPDKEEATWAAAVRQNLLKYKVKKNLPVRQGIRRADHGRYLAVGVCIAIILLSASAHASAIRAFGEVEPGGVAKPLSLI